MARIVILGGGFGGLSCTDALLRQLGAGHDIILVDRSPHFLMGLRKVWLVAGVEPAEPGARALASLEKRGVKVVQAEIESIDAAVRAVTTSAGRFEGDFLVVALGAVPDGSRVPGFHEYNIYTEAGAAAAGRRLAGLESGTVAIGILGLPYKCPPAPYEFAFLVDESLRKRGVREAISLEVFTPQPTALPVAGEEASRIIETRLAERGIGFHAGAAVERIEPGKAVFTDGRSLPFDVLLGVPPHSPPAVVAESDLAGNGGWIWPDRSTLATGFEGVYAMGDVTQIPLGEGRAVPKAGIIAEGEAQVVAAQIAASLGVGSGATFAGEGYCLMELGDGLGASIRGEFFATGGPRVEFAGPSPGGSRTKREFESERLARWFGW